MAVRSTHNAKPATARPSRHEGAGVGPGDSSDSGSDLGREPQDAAYPFVAPGIGADEAPWVGGAALDLEPIDEHEDADLAFIDAADAEADSGVGDSGDPDAAASETFAQGPIQPDRPARPEPPEPRSGGHEPKGPGPLPGSPSPDPEDGADDAGEQRKPGRD